jgi:hypothetical protein
MSEHFQPGQHPDADWLSAFIDHALPPHERQETLTHLAQCADCRSIVFLAQEAAVEELPAEEPVAQLPHLRKRWFSGWTLAWPAAALAACLILAAVYTRHLVLQQNESVSSKSAINAPQQIQQASPQTDSTAPHPQNPSSKLANPVDEDAKASSPTSGANAIARQDFPARSRQVDRLSSQKQIAGDVTSNGAIGGLALQPRVQVNAAPRSAHGTATATGPDAAFGAAAGVAGKSFASVTPPDENANPLALSATQPKPVNGFMLKSAPAPQTGAGAVTVRSANQLSELTITNAQPMITDASANKLAAPQQFNLPSHLETVSSISDARMALAIDSSGTLFASKDSGKHWKSVSARWAGHAVKVDFAFAMPYAQMRVPAIPPVSERKASTANFGSIQAAPPQGKAPANAALAGVVTDGTGAVISNATVTVTNPGTAQSITVRTDGAGNYFVQSLTPGVYTVAAQSPGFKSETVSGIEIASAQPVVKNIALEVGSAAETVSVMASDSTLQTDRLDIGTTIEGQRVQSHVETHPTIFELTTDTGEVWTSLDGSHWKRK